MIQKKKKSPLKFNVIVDNGKEKKVLSSHRSRQQADIQAKRYLRKIDYVFDDIRVENGN